MNPIKYFFKLWGNCKTCCRTAYSYHSFKPAFFLSLNESLSTRCSVVQTNQESSVTDEPARVQRLLLDSKCFHHSVAAKATIYSYQRQIQQMYTQRSHSLPLQHYVTMWFQFICFISVWQKDVFSAVRRASTLKTL